MLVISGLSFTVTVQVPLFPPTVAVITVSPARSAVTSPLSTDAILLFEEDHVISLSVALEGYTVTESVSCSSTVNVTFVLLILTLVTGIYFSLTVTLQDAFFAPSSVVMEIIAEPADTASIWPELETFAMDGDVDSQFIP